MTFGLLDLALAVLAGLLCGAYLVGFRAALRSEQPVARLFAIVLEPAVYWLDLRGPDGRPSHSKIAYVAGLAVALMGLVKFGVAEARGGDGGLSSGFIAYTALVLSYALGKQVFNAIVTVILAKFPGATAALQHRRSGAVSAPTAAEAADRAGPANGSER